MSTSVLIIGADSMIGKGLSVELARNNCNVTGTTRRYKSASSQRPYIDLSDISTFANLPNDFYDISVLCGAVSSVQACEINPEETWAINVQNMLALALRLARAGSHIIYLSSDLVFDGSRPIAKFTDNTSPGCNYGRQKKAVEDSLLSQDYNLSILRLGKVISHADSLMLAWAKSLLAGSRVYPYIDKFFSPVSLDAAIQAIGCLCRNKIRGISHFSASSELSYYEAARVLASGLGVPTVIIDDLVIKNWQNMVSHASSGKTHTTLAPTPGLNQHLPLPSPNECIASFALNAKKVLI